MNGVHRKKGRKGAARLSLNSAADTTTVAKSSRQQRDGLLMLKRQFRFAFGGGVLRFLRQGIIQGVAQSRPFIERRARIMVRYLPWASSADHLHTGS